MQQVMVVPTLLHSILLHILSSSSILNDGTKHQGWSMSSQYSCFKTLLHTIMNEGTCFLSGKSREIRIHIIQPVDYTRLSKVLNCFSFLSYNKLPPDRNINFQRPHSHARNIILIKELDPPKHAWTWVPVFRAG